MSHPASPSSKLVEHCMVLSRDTWVTARNTLGVCGTHFDIVLFLREAFVHDAQPCTM
jgi:hypothetical protein